MASIAEQLNDDQRAKLLGEGEKSVDQAVKLTVQQRVERAAAASPAIWWFTQPSDWEIAPWWSPIRDGDLRNFVHKEGNDILQGAVSSMVKKFRAMNWVVDGPAATVKWAQELLGEAEFGHGWSALIGKTIEDYLVCDNGAFWEIIGKGRADKPLKGLPEGVAHLDSTKCTLTGDPEFPVVFRSGKGKTAHKMHATRVVHMVDMESPNENMNGVGFSAVSRVVASSHLLLLLNKYKREKLSDLPQAGLLVLNNVVPSKWEEAKAEYERERRVLGNELWANIMTLIGVDPAQQASADFVSFSNLPDHFDEAGTITTYVNIVSLAMGLDAREFWPISSGALGTGAESLVMHQKAKGKGIGDLISTIERAINWHLFPNRVSFEFDFQDDEEDAQRASIEDQKARTIISMYTAVDAAGQSLASRAEARQMMADNSDYFLPEFLEADLTGEQEAVDTESEPEGEEPEDATGEDVDRDEGQKYSPDQPRVPAGSPGGGRWTSSGGDSGIARYSPEAQVTAKALRAKAERAEPRITEVITDVVSKMGGELAGLEHRLKTAESMARKLDGYAAEAGTTADRVAHKMKDSVRYTALFPAEEYGQAALKVQQALEARGWKQYDHQFKNYWQPGDDYDGYNCVFEGPEGVLFEFQFHTPESIAVKAQSHKLFAEARELPPSPRRTELFDGMKQLWKSVARPVGWQSLPGVMRFNGA